MWIFTLIVEVGQSLCVFLEAGDAEWRSRFLLLSALWSVCGFPTAVSFRHFSNFIPPARQSGKGWQGGLKYWVMRIINQGSSAEFLLFFFFFLISSQGNEQQRSNLQWSSCSGGGAHQFSGQSTWPQGLLSLQLGMLQIESVINWEVIRRSPCVEGMADKERDVLPDSAGGEKLRLYTHLFPNTSDFLARAKTRLSKKDKNGFVAIQQQDILKPSSPSLSFHWSSLVASSCTCYKMMNSPCTTEGLQITTCFPQITGTKCTATFNFKVGGRNHQNGEGKQNTFGGRIRPSSSPGIV